MENIFIKRTERTPQIEFDFTKNVFALRGESYPEDVPTFFGPPISALQKHLENLSSGNIEFYFELVYFNSTSAKVIMKLFELLDETAQNGVSVTILWCFDPDDDNMQEMGEEFGEDLQVAQIKMCPVKSTTP
ncbi:MAG: DUF1987 domain-containing protein [Magnetococcus sp. DMHC-6]